MGKRKSLAKYLKGEMQTAAKELNFERARTIRDQLVMLEHVTQAPVAVTWIDGEKVADADHLQSRMNLWQTLAPFIEKKYPWYQAPFYGLIEAFNITKKIVVEFGRIIIQLITLHKPEVDVAGPIGIAQYTGQAIKFGKNAVLELLALLSLNLAVINILPFPALDGGRLVFVIYEWISKKKVNQKFEKYLNVIGFALLLTLAVFVTINDLIKIYR